MIWRFCMTMAKFHRVAMGWFLKVGNWHGSHAWEWLGKAKQINEDTYIRDWLLRRRTDVCLVS